MSDSGSQASNIPSPFSKLRVPPTCSASCAAWERPAGLHGSCQDKLCGSQPPSLPARARALLPPSCRPATTRMGWDGWWREGMGDTAGSWERRNSSWRGGGELDF